MAGLPALVLSMVIFGTVGIFRRYIPLPSGWIALARGTVGALFLILVMVILRHRPRFDALRRNLAPLVLSGVFLGFNWILFFESYLYTTVATATVCYYMAPVIVTLLSPLVLRERLTLKKGLCVGMAFVGVILVSEPWQGGAATSHLRGILLGLGAAMLYAGIVLLNKRMKDVPALDRTVSQLLISAVTLLPYALIFEPITGVTFTAPAVLCLLVAGVLHTGVAYALYFGSIPRLGAQTAALCSYIDPVVAILLSVTVLEERIGVLGVIGIVLVIGAALVGEVQFGHRQAEN
ncbi:MAG: DMT family transporter [Clostridia bacterium]|nr:DMT family transporter [Clostridia bacterium]